MQPEAQALLEQYRWPGNVRELRNAIERAMLLADATGSAPRTSPRCRAARRRPRSGFRRGLNLEAVERQLLVQALERAGGNQTQAGYLLGINRDQVRYRIEKFGLTRPNQEAAWRPRLRGMRTAMTETALAIADGAALQDLERVSRDARARG